MTTQRHRDPLWDAITFLLRAPELFDRTRRFIDEGDCFIDLAALEREARPWPRNERSLVDVAHQFWTGKGAISLSGVTLGLDEENFERLVTAMRIRRGQYPDG
jgi:hypothetical protein